MKREQPNNLIWKRRLRWGLLGVLMVIIGFLVGPRAIRAGYAMTADAPEIAALRERYGELEEGSRRRTEIAAWLAMRGVSADPGIRDEGVEHASALRAIYGTTCWAWEDMAEYWAAPASQKSAQELLADHRAADHQPRETSE